MTASEHARYREIITKIYGSIADGSYKPDESQNFEDEDAELWTEDHAMFQYASLNQLGRFMMGQDSG